MPKRGYDDDHEMRDDRGGKAFRDDGGQRRYSGGNEPRGPTDPHRAYFERHKHEEWMLKGYDPKTIERALKKRALEAQQALERFVSHCQGHPLEAPVQFFEDFGRSAMDTEDGKSKDAATSFAPPLFWERVERDLELASRLQHKLDKEKGLSSEKVDAVLPGLADGDDALANVTRLDTILEYLWHVHGINYYAGTELRWKDYHLRQERPRMIRRAQVAKPAEEAAAVPAANGSNGAAEVAMEDGKEEGGAAVKKQEDETLKTAAAAAADGEEGMDVEGEKQAGEGAGKTPPSKRAAKRMARIDSVWEERLKEGQGDPSDMFLGKERVQKILEEFVESHIEKMGEEKFGCKLCTKLFRSAEFVERHIHNKHKSVLEEIEEKANEDVYAQNYVEEKLREDRKSRPYGGGFGRPGFSGPMGGRSPMFRGGFHPRGRFPPPMMAGNWGGRGMMMPSPAAMQAPRQVYNDLDAPKETRTILDYGDL